MTRLLTVLLALSTFPSLTFAQSGEPSWLITGGPVFSQSWLGSEDRRKGGFFSVQYAKREPRISYSGNEGEMAIEGYFLYSRGGGHRGWPVTRTFEYGLLLIGRYWHGELGGIRTYYEGGWGLDYSNRLPFDLDQRLNSAPMLGVGIAMPFNGREIQIGFRWLHVSNAGTNGSNEGHNYLMATVGLRF